MVHLLKKGSGIHIKKSHEGRFTEYCGGNVTEECIRRGKNSPDPKIRKQAVFAQNARKFKHQDGGSIYGASQIQTNANLSQQWKRQQEMGAYKMNQAMGQKKFEEYQNELERQQKVKQEQDLGQSIGNAVGNIYGFAKNKILQNQNDKKYEDAGITEEERQQYLQEGKTDKEFLMERDQKEGISREYDFDENGMLKFNHKRATKFNYDLINQLKTVSNKNGGILRRRLIPRKHG